MNNIIQKQQKYAALERLSITEQEIMRRVMNSLSTTPTEAQTRVKEISQNKTLAKAQSIAANKRVRRSKANRNIWFCGSGNPANQNRWYCVRWDEELDTFVCDCKSYQLGGNNPCAHIYACAIAEGGRL